MLFYAGDVDVFVSHLFGRRMTTWYNGKGQQNQRRLDTWHRNRECLLFTHLTWAIRSLLFCKLNFAGTSEQRGWHPLNYTLQIAGDVAFIYILFFLTFSNCGFAYEIIAYRISFGQPWEINGFSRIPNREAAVMDTDTIRDRSLWIVAKHCREPKWVVCGDTK